MQEAIISFFDGGNFPLLYITFFLFFLFCVGLVFYVAGKIRKDDDDLFTLGGVRLMLYSSLIYVVIMLFVLFVKRFL